MPLVPPKKSSLPLNLPAGPDAVRQRLQAQGGSSLAADNLASFIEPQDLDVIEEKIAYHAEAILQALVVDTQNDPNTRETAERFAKMLVREVCEGRFEQRPDLKTFPGTKGKGTLQIIGPITLRSACAHHLVPILGQVWIGIIPDAAYLGLSKFHRLTQWVMARLQIQEDAAEMLADEIEAAVNPLGCAIMIEAEHLCCSWRGVREQSKMRTLVLRGALSQDKTLRAEFLSLIQNR